jgi:ABC-type nickel/cobalt efflux system permease component RcnA
METAAMVQLHSTGQTDRQTDRVYIHSTSVDIDRPVGNWVLRVTFGLIVRIYSYTRTHTLTRKHTPTHTHTHTYPHTHIRPHTLTHARTHSVTHTHAHTHIRTHALTHARAHTRTVYSVPYYPR